MSGGIRLEYRQWAGFGVGSRVTFQRDQLAWEISFRLVELDGAKAVLECTHSDFASHSFVPYRITLPAPTSSLARRTSRRKKQDRSPVQTDLAVATAPVPPPETQVAQGKEVLDVAGEELVCTWVERQGSTPEHEYRVRDWISPSVPGGLVKSEIHYPQGGGEAGLWMLTSFERK